MQLEGLHLNEGNFELSFGKSKHIEVTVEGFVRQEVYGVAVFG